MAFLQEDERDAVAVILAKVAAREAKGRFGKVNYMDILHSEDQRDQEEEKTYGFGSFFLRFWV